MRDNMQDMTANFNHWADVRTMVGEGISWQLGDGEH
jgi:hypothetical protein